MSAPYARSLIMRAWPQSHPVSGAAQRVVRWADLETGKPRQRTVALDHSARDSGYEAAVLEVMPFDLATVVEVDTVPGSHARAYRVTEVHLCPGCGEPWQGPNHEAHLPAVSA